MKIFLDDTRDIESKYHYNIVRTYDECVELISAGRNIIRTISLDYNLGRNSKTGYDVLVYMVENGVVPQHINIHSNHMPGGPKMLEYAKRHFPNATVTLRPREK